MADIRCLEAALEIHSAFYGGYPAGLASLGEIDEHGFLLAWTRAVPLDPWGNQYRYEPPSPERPQPRIACLGSDGHAGGTGAAADVDNFDPEVRR